VAEVYLKFVEKISHEFHELTRTEKKKRKLVKFVQFVAKKASATIRGKV